MHVVSSSEQTGSYAELTKEQLHAQVTTVEYYTHPIVPDSLIMHTVTLASSNTLKYKQYTSYRLSLLNKYQP